MGGHLLRGENAVKAERAHILRGARRTAAALAIVGAAAFQASAAGDNAGAKLALAPLAPEAALASAAGGPSAAAQPEALAPEAPPGEMSLASLRRSRPELSSETPQDCANQEEYSIPMPWGEESFQDFRDAYLSVDGKSWLAAIMARAEPYLPLYRGAGPFLQASPTSSPISRSSSPSIRPARYREAAPRDSGNSCATRSGGYGIRIDEWVDERRDFIKSNRRRPQQALRQLRVLRRLAPRARRLQCGLRLRFARRKTRLRRSEPPKPRMGRPCPVSRTRDSSISGELRRRGLLSKETRTYVPKFLAVASILRYSAKNGLPILWEDPPSWETVETQRAVDLVLLCGRGQDPPLRPQVGQRRAPLHRDPALFRLSHQGADRVGLGREGRPLGSQPQAHPLLPAHGSLGRHPLGHRQALRHAPQHDNRGEPGP